MVENRGQKTAEVEIFVPFQLSLLHFPGATHVLGIYFLDPSSHQPLKTESPPYLPSPKESNNRLLLLISVQHYPCKLS